MKQSAIFDHPFGAPYEARLGDTVDAPRRAARGRLAAEGLPGPKREEWRFTPLRSLSKIPFIPAAAADDIDVTEVPSDVPSVPDACRIVLVNGRHRPD